MICPGCGQELAEAFRFCPFYGAGGSRSPAPRRAAPHGRGREDEAGEQLRQATAFFRSVGATRYLDESESLLTGAKR